MIEHVVKLEHFAAECRRVLAPGGMAIVCTENLASWHNLGALLLGYQPFSSTNITPLESLGNPFALHAGESPNPGHVHVHVITLRALKDLFTRCGLTIKSAWGAGYQPLSGSSGRVLAKIDPRHSHFICVVASVENVRTPAGEDLAQCLQPSAPNGPR